MRQKGVVIGHDDLLQWLRAERTAGRLTNADVQRLLGLPSSRVAQIFSGERMIKLDEAKRLVEHYGIERLGQSLNAETLAPILEAVLPLAPQGARPEQVAAVLAEALAYGIELLSGGSAMPPSGDAIGVVARAAVLRFRDLSLQ